MESEAEVKCRERRVNASGWVIYCEGYSGVVNLEAVTAQFRVDWTDIIVRNCYSPLSITTYRKRKRNPKMAAVPVSQLSALQLNQAFIRNICILAHVDHGAHF